MAKSYETGTPPIEDMGGFGLTVADIMPTQEQVINMVKAGGGAVGALLMAERLVPIIPWVGKKIETETWGVWLGVGIKFAAAFLGGTFVSRLDPLVGGGLGAGFAGSAIRDVLDTLIFEKAVVPVAPPAVVTDGLGQNDDAAQELFLGADMEEERLFANALNDVKVLTSEDDFGDVRVMESDSPLYRWGDPYSPYDGNPAADL